MGDITQRGCLIRRNPIWRQHLLSAHPPPHIRRSTRMTGAINMTPRVTLLFLPLIQQQQNWKPRRRGIMFRRSMSQKGWFWMDVLHALLWATRGHFLAEAEKQGQERKVHSWCLESCWRQYCLLRWTCAAQNVIFWVYRDKCMVLGLLSHTILVLLNASRQLPINARENRHLT